MSLKRLIQGVMKKIYFTLIVIVFFNVIVSDLSATIRYATASGSGLGTSWAVASNDLQLLINNSVSGDEIWVAAGTYKPNRKADALGTVTATDRNDAFVLKSGVKIYGGFAGSETLLTERNWTTNVTILSGDLGTTGDITDNAYHVVVSGGAVGTAELNGFTVTGGNGNGTGSIQVNSQTFMLSYCGGVYCLNSSPILSNLIISTNTATSCGAGMNITYSSPTVTSVTISSNTVTNGGGGLYMYGIPTNVSSPTFSNCTISGNRATNGGGACFQNACSPTFTTVTFSNNTCTTNGGGIDNQSAGTVTITNSFITGNQATTTAGSGGGIINQKSSPIISNTLIDLNTAYDGAGIYNWATAGVTASPVLTNVSITNNTAARNGGGINNLGASGNKVAATLKNCLIARNTAKFGGGIFNDNYTANTYINTTLANNIITPGPGGGMFNNTAYCTETFKNSIIWGNKLGGAVDNIWNNPGVVVTYNNSLLEGGTVGSGIISNSDPLFINSATGNFHLFSTSPAKDAGNNSDISGVSTDLGGGDRIFNTTVDLGAYEFAPRYVTPTGAGTGAGTSWANASSDLQLMINNSNSGDQIWVKAGTYKPNRKADATSTITANDRNNAFVLKSGVKIYGGFAGSETLLSLRNWTTNVTTLSGDLGAAGPSDNAYHVVVSSGAVSTAELNGFTISSGNADDWSSISVNSNSLQACFGGGLFCYSSSPILSNLILSNNYAKYGGGICNSTSSSPSITAVTLNSNSSISGGGMLNTASSSPTITNIVISNNTTTGSWTNGGGILNEVGSNPTITNALIYKNNATGEGGGIYNINSSPTIINATIVYNTVTGTGGNGNGAGVCASGTGTLTLQNSLIWSNAVDGTTKNVSGSPTYSYTLLEGGTVSGTTIISNSNPQFTNTSTDNYHLTRYSPAINHGSNSLNLNSTDLDGNSRIYSAGTIDLGAYEYQSNDANFAPDGAGVLYVKKGSTGTGNSWGNAIGELSDALLVANNLGTVNQIWVAAGTYYPAYMAGNGTTTRDEAFVLQNNVKIYGGFAGTETLLSQRNYTTNVTILSGDIGAPGNATDNCHHVVISSGSVGTACLDGFTITGGNANVGSTNITVNSNSIYRENGGAIYINSSTPGLSNLIITSNQASALGGGVYVANASTLTLSNITASSNTAQSGAGLYQTGSTVIVNNSSINSNTASSNGGGIYCNTSTLTLSGVILNGNTAATNGGGIYCYVSTLTLSGVTLDGNTAATNGGGICAGSYTNYFTFTNITVKNNIATSGNGGGICFGETAYNSTNFKNILICNNQAGAYGGGVYMNNTWDLQWVNLTMSANNAGTDGGGFYSGGANCKLYNSIIWGNTKAGSTASNCVGTTYYNNTLLQGGSVSSPDIVSNSNPLFVNSAGGDYHLTSTSPAKDLGNNSYISGVSTDLDGLTRIYNTTVDLGCYEFAPAIRYVTPTGAGTGTGTSWANASSDLQLMLNNSTSGDQIWVAAGTYKPNRRADVTATINATDRNNAFVLKSGVKIYGGFAGSETLLSQRNWTTNVTTLSGDLGTPINNTDNAYHVVISAGAVGTAELNGFTITAGNGNEPTGNGSITVNSQPFMQSYCGGVYCFSSSPTLANLIISNNTANYDGGGLNITFSSPTVTGVTIDNNHAPNGGGGGLYIDGTLPALPVFSNCIISNNSADEGGGARFENACSPTFTNVTFSNNTTPNYGGGIENLSTGTVTITNSTITGNSATTTSGVGGGIYNEKSSLFITNTLIDSNTSSTDGGGIYNWATTATTASPVLTNVSITNNTAMGNGGGIYNFGGNGYNLAATLKNCLIAGNNAISGGGIFNDDYTANTYINTTLANNTITGDGGGIYNNGSHCTETFKNSIIWGNKNGAVANNIYYNYSVPTYNYSLLEGGTVSGTSIIRNSDPAFINASSGNYRISGTSVARDAGNNGYVVNGDKDLDGNNRIFNSTVDLGAYESSAAYPVYISGASVIADGTGYTALKTAFDAINAQTGQTGKNIIVTVAGSTTETATASLNNGNWTSMSIYPTSTGLSIKGAAGVQPILFNGADNVTIDGRLHDSSGTLTGSTVDLKLSVTESLDHISVTNGGSGYTSNPTVVFTPTNGGSGATATVTRSGNSVFLITITNTGSGYLSPPTISFTGGGGGSGAKATAYVASKGTIAFDQNAQNNTVKYCRIEGAAQTDLNGTIAFLTGTATNGNGGNTISNNLITNNGVSRPQNSIISLGNTTYPNTGNIITNNEFKDFFATTEESRGIHIVGSGTSSSSGSTGWTITGNSFYETSTLSPTTNSRLYGIKIGFNDASVGGNGYTISDNYFGGTAALCGGTAFTKTSSANNIFSAITLNLASGTPVSSIQNNTIKNMNWANSGGVTGTTDFSWSGIEVGRGDVNIGTVTGNKIGDNTTTGSIVVTGGNVGGNGSRICGIQLQWQATADCKNNTIGSITTANTEPLYANHFYGIYNYSNNATTISNNIIGSASTANSINATSTSQNHDQHVYGIFCTNVSGSTPGAVTINGNMIANMTDGVTNTSAYINGIRSETSATTITNNTIHNLTISNCNNTQSSSLSSISGIAFDKSSSSVVTIDNNTVYNLTNTNSSLAGDLNGIYYSAGSADNSCSNNTIYNISTPNTTGGANIIGLSYNAGTGVNTISRNFISNLSIPASTVGNIYGIKKNSGNVTFSNNIINLGGNYRSTICGIYENGAASNNSNLYFNTVHISGNPGSGDSNKSYCLYSTSSSNPRDFRNNIFSNIRSTSGGLSLHYAVWFNYGVSTNLTLDYNDYYVTGTGGVIGRYNGDLASLPLITGFDANSKLLNPIFTNAGSTTATDYKIGVNLAGVPGTGITSDYAANVRSTEYPAMGAWERAMTNYWKGTNGSDWGTTSNWTLNVLPPTDGNLVFDATPVNNCVMDKDYGVTNITNSQSTYKVTTNGHKLTVKGNLNLSNGAQIDASGSGSTVEFAGLSAQSIPSGAFVGNNVYNLTVNNSNNVTFNGSLSLLNTITAASGKLDAMTNLPTICYAGTASQLIDSVPYLNGKAYNLTIDNAAGVSLSENFVVDHLLTINSGKLLTIPTGQKLNVLGTITNNAGVSGLVIKSAAGVANGTLIFHNAVGNPVSATVEMYSKAYYDSNGPVGYKYKWQYFGIPLRSIVADPTFADSPRSYVYQHNELGPALSASWTALSNLSLLSSFKGYEITQTSPKTISFQGILENGDMSCNLTYTQGSEVIGEHILGNSYTAPIDISQLTFTNMPACVYLYNTGSFADWNSNTTVTTPGTSPGQFVASTPNTAGSDGIPGQIPSMQGFLVYAKSGGGNLSIPYSSLSNKNLNAQRVQQHVKTTVESKVYTIIDVKGSRYNDRMWLFTDASCTHSFDNGWDGPKIVGSSSAPQIYATETDGNYQINAVDDVDNTVIGFQAGEDSNYTFTFNHQNLDLYYKTLLLVDLIENKTVDISQNGSIYEFKATPNSAAQKRFKIVTSANVSTESIGIKNATSSALTVFAEKNSIHIINKTSQGGDLVLYDMKGQVVFRSSFSTNNETIIPMKYQSGVYLVKASTAKVSFATNIFLSGK